MATFDEFLDLMVKGAKLGDNAVSAGANAAADLKTAARATDGVADATRTADTASDATRTADTATDTARTADTASDTARGTASAADDVSKGGFKNWLANHKKGLGITAGVAGAGGLVAYGLTRGGNGGTSREDIISAPGGTLGDVKRAVGIGDGTADGISKMDTVVVRQLAADLRTQADNAAALATSAPEAFDAYRAWLTRDALGAATRDGKASPVVADFDAALADAEKRYVAVAQGLSAQFEGDAAKLERVAAEWEAMEADNAAAINSVDTAVTTANATATPPKDVLL